MDLMEDIYSKVQLCDNVRDLDIITTTKGKSKDFDAFILFKGKRTKINKATFKSLVKKEIIINTKEVEMNKDIEVIHYWSIIWSQYKLLKDE